MLLDEECETIIKELLDIFSKDPTGNEFKFVVNAAAKYGKSLPVFIWCPISQYSLILKCPQHNVDLNLGMWTDNVTLKGMKNPRLVFDVFKNILFLQRFYRCCPDNAESHRILSGDIEVTAQLSQEIQSKFPFKKYHKSMFSFDLINKIFDDVSHGLNFCQIAESIASIKYGTHHQNRESSNFHSDMMYSFPGNDQLQSVFLDEFSRVEAFYKNEMLNLQPGEMISTDHTFKCSKSVGYHRKEDGKFIYQYTKLFIVLNQYKQILDWKLCSSTSHSEVEDLLKKIASRPNKTKIKYIVVDNCCSERQFYESIFPDACIKLDLFHAVKRVTSQIPDKKSTLSKKLIKKFGNVFRHQSDLGSVRTLPTPDRITIMSSLEKFLSETSSHIKFIDTGKKRQLGKEITNLTSHIERNCVSELLPGYGTESNERLHQLLNRSVLRGATVVSPDLAQAVITVVFHYYNSKLNPSYHQCNKKIPIILTKPIHLVSENYSREFRSNNVYDTISTFDNEILEQSTNLTVSQALQLKIQSSSILLKKIAALSGNRCIDLLEILLEAEMKKNFPENENNFSYNNFETIDDILGCFNMNLVRIYSDCVKSSLYNSILHQHSSVEENKIDKLMQPNFLDNLLSRHKVYDLDNFYERYRALDIIANELPCNIVCFDSVIDELSFHVGVSAEKTTSIFIIGYERSIQSFFSTEEVTKKSLESGVCYCGKNTTKLTCSGSGKVKCRCCRNQKNCSSSCFCTIGCCQNGKEIVEPNDRETTSCRCGEKNRKNGSYTSCANVEGQRKSRCPCLARRHGCSDICSCFNCGNEFGSRVSIGVKNINENSQTRKRRHDTIAHRIRGDAQVEFDGGEVAQGPWLKEETICLLYTIKTLRLNGSVVNDLNITTFYNDIANITNGIRTKTRKQIVSKLRYEMRSF